MASGRLDRRTVVRTALALLNQVGMDGLSLRRLAHELGVQAPALYRHFPSKQDLLQAMADSMFDAEMAVLDRPPPGADWADWLIARSRAVRRAMLSYRDGGRLKEHLHSPAEQWPGLELLLQMMEEAGFTVEDALHGIFAAGNHILGAVIAEQEALASRAAAAVEIDPVRFPRLARGAALRIGSRDFDREFDYGLNVIVRGLRATLGHRAGGSPG
jgi:TetR/AcrR family tetracycline transcriptional repressor